MVACVVIHASVLAFLFRRYSGQRLPDRIGPVRATALLVGLAFWTVSAHLVEMALWAAAYVWLGAMPDAGGAAYFSMVTYTTLGYGDVLLPRPWQVLAGVEGLTGILMAGWSTGFLFAVVNRLMLRAEAVPKSTRMP